MHRLTLMLVIALLASAGTCSAQCLPAGAGWQQSYSDEIGFCYYFRDTSTRVSVNFTQARNWCSSATSVSGLSGIRLSRVTTDQQQTVLVQSLTKVGIGYWNIWTDATCNSTTNRYVWGNQAQVSELKSLVCNASAAVQFIGQVTPAGDGSYRVTSRISALPVSELGLSVCEYEVPRCNMSTILNYYPTRMQPDVEPIAGRTVKAACAPGFFRPSEVAGTPDSKVRNRYDCQMVNDSGGIGKAQLIPKNNSYVDGCAIMHCSGADLLNLSFQGDYKDSYKSLIDTTYEYLFGDFIPVQCKTGYVKYTNLTDVNSTILCLQNDMDPSQGQWNPIFCSPVPCNQSAMSGAYDPRTMQMYKAYDRLKDHTYTDAETHLFAYYPNYVYVRCATNGQFFKDRKYDKIFQCNLLPNSSIEAGWSPVEGTLESSMQCQPITCLTNELVALSYRSQMQEYLSRGNFNASVIVTDETGLDTNVTLKDFASISEYKYTVAVRFSCKSGYAMSATNETDGKMVSVTNLQSQCSSLGSWNRIISECIKLTGAIDLPYGKQYVPPAKEAGSAQSLGAIVIVILVVFFSLIVVLDIATLSRDIKLLKLNLRRLKLKARLAKSSSGAT